MAVVSIPTSIYGHLVGYTCQLLLHLLAYTCQWLVHFLACTCQSCGFYSSAVEESVLSTGTKHCVAGREVLGYRKNITPSSSRILKTDFFLGL